MARLSTLAFNSGVVSGNDGIKDIHVSLPGDEINVYSIKIWAANYIAPGTVEIFKKDTMLAADLVYKAGNWNGMFNDPENANLISNIVYDQNKYGNGFLFPYEDDDATNELHVRITNRYGTSQTFYMEIVYEQPSAGIPSDIYTPREAPLFQSFADEEWWIPVEPGPVADFGLSTIVNGDGTVTFSCNKTGTCSYISTAIISRFWMSPDTTGVMQVRSKWTGLNLSGTNWTTTYVMVTCGVMPVFCDDKGFIGSTFRPSTGTKTQAITGQLESFGVNPLYNTSTNFKTVSGISWPLDVLELRFKLGHFRMYASTQYQSGMDFTVALVKVSSNPWEYVNLGASTVGYYNTQYASRYRLVVGLHFRTNQESGLYATLTELEVEKGIIFPS